MDFTGRQRPKNFYEKYYFFMENNKETPPSFEKTLKYINDELGRMEPSFSSKLVATLNPNMPIWDSVVLNNLRLNRLEEIITLYMNIVNYYKDLLDSEKGKIIVELYDQKYPKTGITDVKKVDFVLWQSKE